MIMVVVGNSGGSTSSCRSRSSSRSSSSSTSTARQQRPPPVPHSLPTVFLQMPWLGGPEQKQDWHAWSTRQRDNCCMEPTMPHLYRPQPPCKKSLTTPSTLEAWQWVYSRHARLLLEHGPQKPDAITFSASVSVLEKAARWSKALASGSLLIRFWVFSQWVTVSLGVLTVWM